VEKIKNKILKALTKHTNGINLASKAAREMIANDIIKELKKPSNSQRQVNFNNDKKNWVCQYCGENTWDVYNDYMGTNTNHLECEVKDDHHR